MAMVLLFGGNVARAEPLKVGQPAPDFRLPDQNGKTHTLADYRGKWLALYFYVKDDTPGCTEQACKFRDDIHQLTDLGAQVVGVSVDDAPAMPILPGNIIFRFRFWRIARAKPPHGTIQFGATVAWPSAILS